MKIVASGLGWFIMAMVLWALCTYLFLHISYEDFRSIHEVAKLGKELEREVFSSQGKLNLEDDYDDSNVRMSGGKLSPEPPIASSNSSCERFPKEHCDLYFYLRYWKRRYETKDCFKSPAAHPLGLAAPLKERKYVLFQPDRGGWNNIRMAAETVMVFAHASGRILVLPPKDQWYLLNTDPDAKDNLVTFEDFLNLHRLREVLDIITMDEFVRDVAHQGLLSVAYKDDYGRSSKSFWEYIENATFTRQWEPGKFHIGFNMSLSTKSDKAGIAKVVNFGTFKPKKADLRQRLHASHARTLIPYDDAMHSHRVIFFPGDYRVKYRILTHFYSYIYFAQKKQERQYKRLVRDRLRYKDEIFCAAGRVVRLLHKEAAKLAGADIRRRGIIKDNGEVVGRHIAPELGAHSQHPVTGGGDIDQGATYFAYHIRRGDFQYIATRQSGATIYNNTKHLLHREISQLIFISTDEKNINEFVAFRGGTDRETGHPRYVIRFLRDYINAATLGHKHMSPNEFGMVEQLVCANAHTFFGTPLSTFTGYITRLRGYYRDDRYANTFYWMPESMYTLHRQTQLKGPFWAREFAVAHADIDDDGISPPRYSKSEHRSRHSRHVLKKQARDLDYIVRDSYRSPHK